MVPLYIVTSDRTTATYLPSAGSTTSTDGANNNQLDRLLLTLTQLQREKEKEDLSNLSKEKPKFDRVMKMRNTDGQVRSLPIWRPMRLVSRGNIGVRNFQAR